MPRALARALVWHGSCTKQGVCRLRHARIVPTTRRGRPYRCPSARDGAPPKGEPYPRIHTAFCLRDPFEGGPSATRDNTKLTLPRALCASLGGHFVEMWHLLARGLPPPRHFIATFETTGCILEERLLRLQRRSCAKAIPTTQGKAASQR